MAMSSPSVVDGEGKDIPGITRPAPGVNSKRVKRIALSPLIGRALDVAEKHLGIEELCHRLVVPEATIRAWRFGHAAMPEYKFLRLVDVLMELDPSWVEWDEAQPK